MNLMSIVYFVRSCNAYSVCVLKVLVAQAAGDGRSGSRDLGDLSIDAQYDIFMLLHTFPSLPKVTPNFSRQHLLQYTERHTRHLFCFGTWGRSTSTLCYFVAGSCFASSPMAALSSARPLTVVRRSAVSSFCMASTRASSSAPPPPVELTRTASFFSASG